MKVLIINSVCGYGSTGRICVQLAQKFEADGHEVKIAYGRLDKVQQEYKKYAVRIGTDVDCKMHAVQTRLFDTHGFGSKKATRVFLKWAEEYKPDLLWLHNIHDYYINVEMLFEWIKKHPQIQVKWTLHDCWAFTGHCTHFSFVKCEQWKSKCQKCPQLRRYPACIGISNVSKNFERKKKAFTGVKNLTLITPSAWLADLTRESFLKEYPVQVEYPQPDTDVFKPTESDFRQKYSLEDKFIVLGVSNVWENRKGLYDFYTLADMLDDNYKIVLVGLTEEQLKSLPQNILGIKRTENVQELAAIYTAADVFVNPSVEESFGLTPEEAFACGTPSIVYKGTACEEIAKMRGNITVPQDVKAIYNAVTQLCNHR